MDWTNCNEELPPAKTDIWVKYKNMRPMFMDSGNLIDEYKNRDKGDDNNYWWRLA